MAHVVIVIVSITSCRRDGGCVARIRAVRVVITRRGCVRRRRVGRHTRLTRLVEFRVGRCPVRHRVVKVAVDLFKHVAKHLIEIQLGTRRARRELVVNLTADYDSQPAYSLE